MMSKYSKFGLDTFNTVWAIGYIEILHNDSHNDDQMIIIAQLFLWNNTSFKWQLYMYICKSF